jgi:hypothetical protein
MSKKDIVRAILKGMEKEQKQTLLDCEQSLHRRYSVSGLEHHFSHYLNLKEK